MFAAAAASVCSRTGCCLCICCSTLCLVWSFQQSFVHGLSRCDPQYVALISFLPAVEERGLAPESSWLCSQPLPRGLGGNDALWPTEMQKKGRGQSWVLNTASWWRNFYQLTPKYVIWRNYCLASDSVWSLLSQPSVGQSNSHFPPDNCLAFLSYCISALMSPRLGCLLRDKMWKLLILPFFLLFPCWPSPILKGLEAFCLAPAGSSAREGAWRLFISAGVGRAVLGKQTGSGALQAALLGCKGEAGEDGNALLGSPATNLPRRRVVFAGRVASARDGSESCSHCFAPNRAPGEFWNLLSSTLTWTNITGV